MSEQISRAELIRRKQEYRRRLKDYWKHKYEMLLRCSRKRDMTEWNEWYKVYERANTFSEVVNLRCVDLEEAYLSGANLKYTDFFGANLKSANLSRANLQGAKLFGAKLQGADLRGALFDEKFLK